MKEHDSSKREFVKKAVYVVPAVLTLTAVASVAKAGSENDSGEHERDDDFSWWDWLRRLLGF